MSSSSYGNSGRIEVEVPFVSLPLAPMEVVTTMRARSLSLRSMRPIVLLTSGRID